MSDLSKFWKIDNYGAWVECERHDRWWLEGEDGDDRDKRLGLELVSEGVENRGTCVSIVSYMCNNVRNETFYNCRFVIEYCFDSCCSHDVVFVDRPDIFLSLIRGIDQWMNREAIENIELEKENARDAINTRT